MKVSVGQDSVGLAARSNEPVRAPALVGKLLEEQDVDVLREGIRVLSQALIETEVAGLIGAERHERTGERAAFRTARCLSRDTSAGNGARAAPKGRLAESKRMCESSLAVPGELAICERARRVWPVVGGCVTLLPRQLHENRVQHETIARPAPHAGRHHASPIARSIPSEMLAKRLQIAEARVVARPQAR